MNTFIYYLDRDQIDLIDKSSIVSVLMATKPQEIYNFAAQATVPVYYFIYIMRTILKTSYYNCFDAGLQGRRPAA